MSMTAKLIGNRRWSVAANGDITSLTRRYLIVRDTLPSAANAAAEEIASCTGLPALGSAHSTAHSNLVCVGYAFEEGTDGNKKVLFVDVTYSSESSSASEANKVPRGQDIESCGWRSGSVSRDLVKDAATGETVLNSAGQPFDSVPQIDVPAPTFHMTKKTVARQTTWKAAVGKVNAASVTIGGVSGGKHCFRVVQCDEEKLWNDEFGYGYRYTIAIQLMSNLVKIEGGSTETDIGWDLGIVDCGTYQKNPFDASEVTPIQVESPTTGKPCYVTSPVLLDGSGQAMLEFGATPYVFRVQAYPETTIPSAMYDESPTKRGQEDDN